MKLEIVTSPIGAELTSIKYNSEERLHQGESVLDKEGKVLATTYITQGQKPFTYNDITKYF